MLRPENGLIQLYREPHSSSPFPISKLADYRKLVSRKIKANQAADLLKSLNTHKMEEEETQMFYNRFDKAFMELYPGFVTELNKLLLPESQLEVPTTHTLTTEIRIYSRIRFMLKQTKAQ